MRLTGLCELSQRLKSETPELAFLITFDPSLVTENSDLSETYDCDWIIPLPANDQLSAQGFLSHWSPDICLWTGGYLKPILIQQTASTGMPLILLDADETGFDGFRKGWFSDPLRDTLNLFTTIMAANDSAAGLLQRTGLGQGRVQVTESLRIGSEPPSFPDEEVAEVSRDLAGRPSWLAAHIQPDEFGLILIAHRQAVRRAHRLLLVVMLDDRAFQADLLDLLDGMKMRHAVWHLGDPIDDNTQVLVVDDHEDLGLWYRISPQTFIGGSLIPGTGGCAPQDVSSLGSAVLFGPHVQNHLADYERLTKAGAARQVADGNELGAEVTRLMAPDLAAEMAFAGWEVVTEGAELIVYLQELVQDYLGIDGATHAPT